MNSVLIHPRLSYLCATTSRAIVFFSVLLFAVSAFGQSMPGFQAPDKPKVTDDTPTAIKAARGEVPFSQMYGHLKLDSTKAKRLGQLTPSDLKQKNKNSKFVPVELLQTWGMTVKAEI